MLRSTTVLLATISLLGPACDGAQTPAAKPAAKKADNSETKDKAPVPAQPATEQEKAAPDAPAEPEAPAKPEAKPVAEFPPLAADAKALDVMILGGKLMAPQGAKLGMNINGWQEIAAGKTFVMVAKESYDKFSELKKEIGDAKIVVEDDSTVVYEKDGGFGFIAIVEAKGAEEYEGEADRRIECREGSSKEWAIQKKAKGHPREVIDQMVGVCRSFAVE